MTVHILEDDPGVCDSLLLLLQQMGHEALAYPDAESFFEVPPPSSSDVVIVDLGLPGIAGSQVVRWTSQLKSPPKVIVISGQPQTVINEALRELDSPILVRKPLTEDAIATLF